MGLSNLEFSKEKKSKMAGREVESQGNPANITNNSNSNTNQATSSGRLKKYPNYL
jgi:hypothetical protein